MGLGPFHAPSSFIGADHRNAAAAAHAFEVTLVIQLGTAAGAAMANDQTGEMHVLAYAPAADVGNRSAWLFRACMGGKLPLAKVDLH